MAKQVTNTKTAIARASQAQKERQEQVTETQSLTLVKNLIRVSISTVCSLRGIFPHSCFQERTYAGMKIYQLDAASRDADTNETIVKDQEAYDLTKWLESGVFEAIELRYLRRMEFIITSPQHENPREAYSFDLTYPDDPRDPAITVGGTKVTTVASTKGQLIKLIRSLIAFGNTLGELPRERFLNIKLWYFEDRTPPGWQPKHFREADPAELKFSKGRDDKDIDSKLKIKIGDLTTPHHTLLLRFTGYDNQVQQEKASGDAHEVAAGDSDDCGVAEGRQDDSNDGAGSHDGRWSGQGSPSLLKCQFGPEREEDDDSRPQDDSVDDDEETEVPAGIAERDASRMLSGMMTQLDVAAKGNPRDNYDADCYKGHSVKNDTAYEAAKAWALPLARPTIAGLMAHLDLPKELARQFLDRMVDERLFVKRNFRFHRSEDTSKGCPSTRVLPSLDATGRADKQEESSGRDAMDTDAGADAGADGNANVPEDGCCGRGGDTGHGNFSSQKSSGSDDSETQPPIDEQTTTDNRALSHRDQQRKHTPSSMPPPFTALGRRRLDDGGGRGGKPQRNPIVSMATKRVLEGSALSGRGAEDDGLERAQDNHILHEEEPIDVFNPEEDSIRSATGYERLALSQASATSAAESRPKRKCSLAINPIHQIVPSKRLRVEQNVQRQGRG
eukprot:g17670.t1